MFDLFRNGQENLNLSSKDFNQFKYSKQRWEKIGLVLQFL